MRLSVDSNVLVYGIDGREAAKREAANTIIDELTRRDSVLTLQAIAEFMHVVVRKRIAPAQVAWGRVELLLRLFPAPVPASTAALRSARLGWLAGRFSLWDSLLLATAATAGCEAVISEDMHDGATLDGVRVIAAFDAAGAVSPDARAALGLP